MYEGKTEKEMGEEMCADYERELLELENTLSDLTRAVQTAVSPESVYLYLSELLSLHGSNNDELIKVLFDKVIEKILIYDDRIEVHMVVIPFAHIGDNRSEVPPHYSLSLQAKKELCTIR